MLKLDGDTRGRSEPASRSDNRAAVALEDVTKSFRGPSGVTTVVDELSMTVGSAEFFSLLGPSGCGKTTTLRLIAGLERVDSGRVLLDGNDATGLPAHSRNVNTVFQNYALFPHLNVFDNVAYGLRRHKVGGSDLRKRVREALELVHMEAYGFYKSQQLSGGQQQRVALARALVNRPSVLLLDEPLAALDLKLREAMQEELKRLQRELQLTFIFVTHDQAEAFAMSDRVAVMERGKLVQIGAPEELYLRPANRFVATFVGRANFIPLELVEGGSRSVVTELAARRIAAGAEQVTDEEETPHDTEPRARSGGLIIFVRPERMHLIHATEQVPAGTPRVRGTVVDKTFSGGVTTVRILLRDGVEVMVTADSDSKEVRDSQPGEEADVTWRADDATVLE